MNWKRYRRWNARARSRAYLEIETAENIARGMTPADAATRRGGSLGIRH
jgi:hypothetical protein